MDECFDSWYLLSPKGSLSSLGKAGNPSLSMNSTLLVVIDLVLMRQYLFLVPETFRNVQ